MRADSATVTGPISVLPARRCQDFVVHAFKRPNVSVKQIPRSAHVKPVIFREFGSQNRFALLRKECYGVGEFPFALD